MNSEDYIYDDTMIDDLTDVKEEKAIVPATKDVRMFIKDVQVRDRTKEGEPLNWKTLNVTFTLVDGINVEGTQLYVNKNMFKNICYSINKDHYDMSKPFFGKQQYLVELKQLLEAVGAELKGLSVTMIRERLIGKQVLGSIIQQKETVKDKETGERVETGDFINDIKWFKPVPAEMRV